MSARPNYCTCHMDGSFITSCPTHGKRMTLVRQAEQRVRSMTTPQLRAFLQARPPLPDEGEARMSPEENAKDIVSRVKGFAGEMKDMGIHVGFGPPPRCVTCGDAWPCAASGESE